MKLGIMQPYFLPYIGYWQLLNAVDKYVIYDDVNFIKGGWIGRNRILLNGEPHYLNIQMSGASSNKKINEVGVKYDPVYINKSLKMLQAAYSKAPYYQEGCHLISDILQYKESNLALFLEHSIRIVCDYLGINTELLISSHLEKDNSLHGQDKVIHICRKLGCDEYYNAIGGQTLYSYNDFKESGISLIFLQSNKIYYKQLDNDFVPDLSILDCIMFNPVDKIQKYLDDYILITGK